MHSLVFEKVNNIQGVTQTREKREKLTELFEI